MKSTCRHFLFFILLTGWLVSHTSAQPFKNSWIDYSKTYYKFKVGPFGFDIVSAPIKKGLVRISQSVLQNNGLGNVPAERFQLWHNGQEQPIYTSKSNGILSAEDFIEFYGEIADGTIDRDLYPHPDWQLGQNWNLSTDSSTYYLTTNPGLNKRLIQTPNNAASSLLPVEKNFRYTVGRYYRAAINNGFGVIDSKILYLSSYERGEGFSSRPVRPNNCGCSTKELPQVFSSLYADTVMSACQVALRMVGNAQNERDVKILLNGDSIFNVKMNFFNAAFPVISGLSASRIVNDQATILVRDSCLETTDEIRVVQTEFTYRRKFNFGNASLFEFLIDPSPAGRLINIVNFNGGSVFPVLYDLSNGKRYTALNNSSDTLRFLLQPSMIPYTLVLVKGDGSTAQNISHIQALNFNDFTALSKQGNYIIITHPLLLGNDPSNNFTEQYRLYRNSAAGGSYNAKIYTIGELEDQFAFGVKQHPLAVKEFLRFAKANFQQPPKQVFIIGKGVSYAAYRMTGQNPIVDRINLVPTFGFPGSDNLLAASGQGDLAEIPIGRLSAVSTAEVGIYLNKVKQYELLQKQFQDSVETQAWKKQVLQLTGANDPVLGVVLDTMMRKYKEIISDTSFGATVNEYSKTGDPEGFSDAVVNFSNVYNRGSALVTYFGHSSAQAIDFSLDNPNNYSNIGRYPFFLVNGCLAGNIFDYDANRPTILSSLSEKFVLAPERGSIGYLSSSNYGVVNYLDVFTTELYRSFSQTNYGSTMGEMMRQACSDALNFTGSFDFFGRMHAQQYTLHGDPALKLNNFNLPDYAIQANQMYTLPQKISISDESYDLIIRIFNLGKASKDSINILVERSDQISTGKIIFKKRLKYISASDSLKITIPIRSNVDGGEVSYSVKVDSDNKIVESNENNNTASFKVFIQPVELKPVYPYNYSIISNNIVRLAASTSLLTDTTQRRYIAEIDSTALFNSPAKKKFTVTSKGGLILFRDVRLSANNQVYFWRVAPDVPTRNKNWNTFSFTYESNGSNGFQQKHFFQHTESILRNISGDSLRRRFTMSTRLNNLYLRNAIFPTSGQEDLDFSIAVNGSLASVSACVGSSIIFHVFDSLSFRMFENTTNPFGAAAPCTTNRSRGFEFSTQTAASRKNAMDFIDQYIPNGSYVAVRKVYDLGNADWAPTVWAADTALYGSGNSLYHRFRSQGLAIDSFTYPRTFIFIFKKNQADKFTPVSIFSQGIFDRISYSGNLPAVDTLGTITSPLFGPVNSWNRFDWVGFDLSNFNNSSLAVFANNGRKQDSLLFTLNKTETNRNIQSLDAKRWPFIYMKLQTADSITVLPYQLDFWRVTGAPTPEGTLAPNAGFRIPKVLVFPHPVHTQYDSLKGMVSFVNLSQSAFKPLKLLLQMIDSSGKIYEFNLPRTSAVAARDSVQIRFNVNVNMLPAGQYNLMFLVNPGNDQPEQYLFNNKLFHFIEIQRPESVVANVTVSRGVSCSVKLTPNPFMQVLWIQGIAPGIKTTVRCISIDGRVLWKKIVNGPGKIDIPSMPAGTCYIEAILPDQIHRWKMLHL